MRQKTSRHFLPPPPPHHHHHHNHHHHPSTSCPLVTRVLTSVTGYHTHISKYICTCIKLCENPSVTGRQLTWYIRCHGNMLYLSHRYERRSRFIHLDTKLVIQWVFLCIWMPKYSLSSHSRGRTIAYLTVTISVTVTVTISVTMYVTETMMLLITQIR